MIETIELGYKCGAYEKGSILRAEILDTGWAEFGVDPDKWRISPANFTILKSQDISKLTVGSQLTFDLDKIESIEIKFRKG